MSVPAEIEAYILSHLEYDASSLTGLRWVSHVSSRARAGDPALRTKNQDGYFHGQCMGKTLVAHRVVYFLCHNVWPAKVDHINGDRSDNHMDNLRAVSDSENAHNRVGLGFFYDSRRSKYKAYIRAGEKRVHLGYFKSEAEARAAYLSAKRELHPTAPARCFLQGSQA